MDEGETEGMWILDGGSPTPRKRAFICSTPLHVLNATRMALTLPVGENHLLLQATPSVVEPFEHATRAWAGDPFRGAYVLARPASLLGKGGRLTSRLVRDFLQSSLLSVQPESLYLFADQTPAVQIAVRRLLAVDPSLDLNYVEDGSAAYNPTPRPQPPPWKAASQRLIHGQDWQWIEHLGTAFPYRSRYASFPKLAFQSPRHQLTWQGFPPLDLVAADTLENLSRRWLEASGPIPNSDPFVLLVLPRRLKGRGDSTESRRLALLIARMSAFGLAVAVKDHPSNTTAPAHDVRRELTLDPSVPSEILLLSHALPIMAVVGPSSSALLMARRELPEAPVIAIDEILGRKQAAFAECFPTLGISQPSTLAEFLEEAASWTQP